MSWESVRLNKIIEVKKGKYITRKESIPGPYPVILGGREPAYYINQFNHTGKAIVVSRSGASAGYVSFWNEPIFVTDGFLIEAKETVNIDFLYYLMKSCENQFLGLQGGSAIPRVTPKTIGNVEVKLPSLEKQVKIVDILLMYDKLIENNQKQIKLLEEAAQRLYKEWFVDLRFPGYEDTPIVDGVPEGWQKTNIGEFLSVRSGYAFKSSWWQKEGYPVVKIKDISNNTVDISGVDYVSPDKTLKIPEFKLRKGDIVIAMTGATIGKIGLVPEVENLYTNQRVGKFFPKNELTNPSPFVFCFYNQKKIIDKIIALSSSSSAQPNISGGQLESFEVIANVDIINEFCVVAQPLFEKIHVLYRENSILIQARDRLLPKLMNGEIEV